MKGVEGSSVGSLPEIILAHYFRLEAGKLVVRRGRERGKKRLRIVAELIKNQTKGRHVFS